MAKTKAEKRNPTVEWEYRGCRCELVLRTGMTSIMPDGWWCGYATITNWPFGKAAPDANAVVDAITVHGGVTWQQNHPDGSMTLGFDCGHYYPEGSELAVLVRDQAWLRAETERMADQALALIGRGEKEG